MITNYTELSTAVENWLDNTDQTSRVPEFITLGENRIYRQLRIRAMETTLNVTMVNAVATIPTDYAQLKHARISGNPTYPLEKKDAEWILRKYPTRQSEHRPFFIAEDIGNFIFGPYPDTNYTVLGTYYKRLAALSGSNLTNWFTDYAPDLLLHAALAEAWEYIDEDRKRDYHEGKYQTIAASIELEEKRQRKSGSPQRSVAS